MMSGKVVLGILIVSLALIYLVVQAGDLEPPGPPGPTMKPLNELEPRTPIHADQMPLHITASGSYYFVAAISTTGDGIVIDADDVTIDLNGFTFSGGTGYGIMGAFVKNTEIRNGVVADWEKHGIDLGGSYLSRVIDVRAVNNSIEADYAGIKASGGSRVVGCIASSNHLGHGIWLSNGSYATVTDSVTEANGQDGIRVDGSGCVLRDNNSNGNVGAGLMVTVASGSTPWANFDY
jgi:parallel beta-helix repeat protein